MSAFEKQKVTSVGLLEFLTDFIVYSSLCILCTVLHSFMPLCLWSFLNMFTISERFCTIWPTKLRFVCPVQVLLILVEV